MTSYSNALRRAGTAAAFALVVAAAPGARDAAAQIGGLSGIPGQEGARSSGSKNPGTSDLDELTQNLRDDDPAVRLEAVKGLAASNDKEAIEHLIEATADVDPRVKIKAIDALGTLRAGDATSVLVQMLYMRESEPWLKQRVLVALGKIGDSRAADPIADFLARDSDVATEGTAIFALGEIGDPGSVPTLQGIAGNASDERLQRLARDAIAKIEQKQVNPEVVVKALRDTDEEQRPAAASAAAPLAY